MIDFRSDTVTRPTPGMLAAMQAAPTGDDVFGEDPTVNRLEQLCAGLFGMEAAVFCPSGTMTNQIAIKCHTQPGDEVICEQLSHVYQYEGGGIAFNSGCSVRLLHGDRGRITATQVKQSINADDKARRIRKVFGGGMRQAGYLAAAGIYALENNVARLADDHAHAQRIAAALQKKDFVGEILPVETNIIIFEVKGRFTAPGLSAILKQSNIYAIAISSTQIRFVLHLDISSSMVDETIRVIDTL
eukprot:jgi/Mesen1/3373/ME001918S02326